MAEEQWSNKRVQGAIWVILGALDDCWDTRDIY